MQCPNHDNDHKCVLKHVEYYDQTYFATHWMGIKKSSIKSCIIHGYSKLDLLRDRKNISFCDNGTIYDKPLNQTIELDKEIISIAVTHMNPSRRRTIHVTRHFITNTWMGLMHKPNIQFLYDQIILNYAQHAHKMYSQTGTKVSMTRLINEAGHVFMTKKTFSKLMINYFRQRAKQRVLQVRHLISLYPYRIVGIDGNRKFAQKLYIQDGKNRYQSNCSYNTVLAASTGFILTTLIYPDADENQERMTEMLIKPFAHSVQHSPIHKDLIYGIGIDHPQRDYSLADYFYPKFKQHLISINNNIHDKTTVFLAKSNIQYNLKKVNAFVKLIHTYKIVVCRQFFFLFFVYTILYIFT